MKRTFLFNVIVCLCLIVVRISFSAKFEKSRYIEQLTQFCAGKYSHMCTDDLMEFSLTFLKTKSAVPVKPKNNQRNVLKESQYRSILMKNNKYILGHYFRLK